MTLRTDQVSANIYRLVGEIFAKDLEFPLDTLVSISKVEVTPNLKQASVYVSVLPFDHRGQVSNLLKKELRHVQSELNKQLTLKFSPHLSFYIDDTQEYVSSIEQHMDEPLA
jgi:ribosome-binding factor A